MFKTWREKKLYHITYKFTLNRLVRHLYWLSCTNIMFFYYPKQQLLVGIRWRRRFSEWWRHSEAAFITLKLLRETSDGRNGLVDSGYGRLLLNAFSIMRSRHYYDTVIYAYTYMKSFCFISCTFCLLFVPRCACES